MRSPSVLGPVPEIMWIIQKGKILLLSLFEAFQMIVRVPVIKKELLASLDGSGRVDTNSLLSVDPHYL